MSTVSLFESEVKNLINNIVTNPTTVLPKLNTIVRRNPDKYIDVTYGKFLAYENLGIETLSASDFYNIFGGNGYKIKVEHYFDTYRLNEIKEYHDTLALIKPLLDKTTDFDNEYLKNDDIFNRLNGLNFSSSESAFLKLKLRRNKVAHNFLSGISDSFEDIRNLYYDAVLYVVALKQALRDLSTI